MENPEINPDLHYLNFNKVDKTTVESLFETYTTFISTLNIKINLRCIMDLNKKAKTIKHKIKTTTRNSWDLKETQKVKTIKMYINKILNFLIKIYF
jgi:formiminotetrahydrofolate cyclodeaminase